MDKLIDYLFDTFFLFLWVLGFVLAQGFWSTLACVIPFYALYLDVKFFITFLI